MRSLLALGCSGEDRDRNVLSLESGRAAGVIKNKIFASTPTTPPKGCPSLESLPSSKCCLGAEASWGRLSKASLSSFTSFCPFLSCTELKHPTSAGKHHVRHATQPSPRVAALPPALPSQHLEMPQILFFHPKSTDNAIGLCNEPGNLCQAPHDEHPTGIHNHGDGNDPKATVTGTQLPGHTVLVPFGPLL